MSVFFALILSGEHFPQLAIDAVQHRRRQFVEGGRVDHVAARISEQPRLQIKLPQRPALFVERTAGGEILGESRSPFNRGSQRRFLGEQQIFDDRFRRLWEYYLSYCEAGFLSGNIDVRQVVFAKPG